MKDCFTWRHESKRHKVTIELFDYPPYVVDSLNARREARDILQIALDNIKRTIEYSEQIRSNK